MDNSVSGFLTGFSQSLNQYLQTNNQLTAQQNQEIFKNKLAEQSAIKKEGRELANQKELKTYEAGLSKEAKTYELTLAGKISPEAAQELYPELYDAAVKFNADNGRDMTVDEFNKLASEYGRANTPKPTGAQTAVDKAFAKTYEEYVASGGYADTINQIQSLEGVAKDLKSGKNLTGPILGAVPEFARKRINPKSMEAQQAVEQSIQKTLRLTMGPQFTEREGTMFMQRGYDPSLPESVNAKKLQNMIGQLKTMAISKQKAIDYYEEHGTLTGFKGEFYTLKDGVMVKASKDDFYSMFNSTPEESSAGASEGWSITKL